GAASSRFWLYQPGSGPSRRPLYEGGRWSKRRFGGGSASARSLLVIVVALPYSGAHRRGDAGGLIRGGVVGGGPSFFGPAGAGAGHSFCGQAGAVRGGREHAHACLRSIGPVDHQCFAQAAFSSAASTW